MAMIKVASRAMGMVMGPTEKPFAGIGCRHCPKIGAPREKRQISQYEVDTKRTEVRHHGRRLNHPVDQEPLYHVANERSGKNGEREREKGIYMIKGKEPIRW